MDQVAATVQAMAGSRVSSGKVSVSLDPDELGRIGITVERRPDGTTSVHVQAERLATLDLLRADQSALARALDQADRDEGGPTLSFSWGGEGGRPEWDGAWGSMADLSGEDRVPSAGPDAYAGQRSSQASRAASRGGLDVTA